MYAADVVIGEGLLNHGGSWVLERNLTKDGTCQISKGSVSYLLSGFVFGLDGIIARDTPEGKKLTAMLAKTPTSYNTAIRNYLDGVILKHVGVSKLKEKIKQALDRAYEKGREDKAREIRTALESF